MKIKQKERDRHALRVLVDVFCYEQGYEVSYGPRSEWITENKKRLAEVIGMEEDKVEAFFEWVRLVFCVDSCAYFRFLGVILWLTAEIARVVLRFAHESVRQNSRKYQTSPKCHVRKSRALHVVGPVSVHIILYIPFYVFHIAL